MIDKNKEYTTRDGREVRIYATDGKGDYPVHGAWFNIQDDRWMVEEWTAKGEYYWGSSDSLNLIEKPKIIKGWINIYPGNNISSTISPTKIDADNLSTSARIACIQIEFKEGEGL